MFCVRSSFSAAALAAFFAATEKRRSRLNWRGDSRTNHQFRGRRKKESFSEVRDFFFDRRLFLPIPLSRLSMRMRFCVVLSVQVCCALDNKVRGITFRTDLIPLDRQHGSLILCVRDWTNISPPPPVPCLPSPTSQSSAFRDN